MSAPNGNTEWRSSLMIGQVRHRRFTPVEHALNYPLFMPCIDLDEWPQLANKIWGLGERWWHWARFRREDYLGQGPLKQAVLDKVEQLTGERIDGRVVALIHLRYLGIYFSPVNFYYVYDAQDHWRYLLAEVSNTPWNERHYYAIPAQDASTSADAAAIEWQHAKAFHVSPFNPIEQMYHWRIKPLSRSLMIHLECHRAGKEFDATLSMQAERFTPRNLLPRLIKTPIMAVKVVLGIYWHAFKLWRKGAPFYSHPDRTQNNNKEQPHVK
ncbi:DUF1365 domain-containing protein [Vibrio mimicus]|uniref:DUF1365 domain-containing protein n=1 Tax=Vibrio mimicus TaxID=674 RepID=UPI0011D30178|nr:DUF1365 domain-containing protein [Vibrio mimicus]TXY03978.1 DUF1365 domain-containing protein [Vibrio mimicus]